MLINKKTERKVTRVKSVQAKIAFEYAAPEKEEKYVGREFQSVEFPGESDEEVEERDMEGGYPACTGKIRVPFCRQRELGERSFLYRLCRE